MNGSVSACRHVQLASCSFLHTHHIDTHPFLLVVQLLSKMISPSVLAIETHSERCLQIELSTYYFKGHPSASREEQLHRLNYLTAVPIHVPELTFFI